MEYLIHYGIEGQKWGQRRYQYEDGSLTPAGKERYSREQWYRDKGVYGRSGANRIQRKVERGQSVSGARSEEAARINGARSGAQIAGKIGSVAGGLGGVVAAYKYGDAIVGKLNLPADVAAVAKGTIMAGAATAGSLLGSKLGKASVMSISGYSPSKYR